MPSPVPIDRSTPIGNRMLAGFVSLRIVVDASAIQQIKRELDDKAKASAKSLAVELGNRAVEFMSQADAGAGRKTLARLWTNTKPVLSPSGVAMVEVYNAGENQTFVLQSNARDENGRQSNKVYPIQGNKLLDILLNGSKAHLIRARASKHVLMFGIRRGESASKTAAGAALLKEGVGIARYINPNRPNDMFSATQVSHPGVAPSRFLQLAKIFVEDIAATQGGAIVSAVVRSNTPASTV